MSQEKKKIRVLSPQKNNKKISPWLSGVLGVTLGISVTSAIFLTYRMTSSSEITARNSVSDTEIDKFLTDNNIASSNLQMDEFSDQENNEGDDYQASQPKINELTKIFKHPKAPVKTITTTESAEEQITVSTNPFENAFGQAKPEVATTTVPPAKQQDTPAFKEQKTVLPDTLKKPVEAKTKMATARHVELSKNDKPQINRNENVEAPHASVQISVTHSAKELSEPSP